MPVDPSSCNPVPRVSALAALVLFLLAPAASYADSPAAGPPDLAGLEFFEAKVRPVLTGRCYKCHSASAEKVKGGLLLDTRDGLLQGGDNGPALVPGKADESLLVRAVRYEDKDLRMPPKEALPKEQVAILEQWVRMGAPDPRTTPAKATVAKDLWSLHPVRPPSPPAVRDEAWPASAIDRFVLARLEEKGLHPARPAGKRELLRRVTVDLTGLPPTPEDVAAFEADSSPDAYAKVVDRLLASPRYGERWGRHWLDVVRFGESHGYEQNHLRDRAWPYRDYVIRSFNEDKPYPRFVAEQLAGDVLAAGDANNEVGTGFLVAGVHDTVGNNAEQAKRQQRADDLDDVVSTVGATFLGLTVGCAKCHDHKFDPIPQADYYALSAVFAGVRHDERAIGGTRGKTIGPRRNVEEFAPTAARFVRFVVEATNDGAEPCLDELEVYAAGADANLALAAGGARATASSLLPGYAIHQVAHLNDGLYGNDHSWISNERGRGWAQVELAREASISRVVWSRDNRDGAGYADRLPSKYHVDVSTDGRAWKTVARVGDENAGREPAKAYVGEFTAPDTVYLLKRGDVMQRGAVVGPAGLSRVPELPADLHVAPSDPEPARRVALAKWICEPRNPLAARVMVNRVWQHHFGRGIVGTPSDFGANGEPPSHPELLDWLADDFVKNGWTLKRLHREIVLSRTYQQTGRPDDAALGAGLKTDAGNRLLWRMPLRRLEAEAVRDSILCVSGKLDLSPTAAGGPGFRLFRYKVVNIGIYDALPDQGPETWRRAVYQQTARNIHDDLMAAFDEPENAQRTPRRESTTSPLQALTLLNSPFAVQQAEYFAARVKAGAGNEPTDQVATAFLFAFGREPSKGEREAGVDLVKRRGLPVLCRALFSANEFLTY